MFGMNAEDAYRSLVGHSPKDINQPDPAMRLFWSSTCSWPEADLASRSTDRRPSLQSLYRVRQGGVSQPASEADGVASGFSSDH